MLLGRMVKFSSFKQDRQVFSDFFCFLLNHRWSDSHPPGLKAHGSLSRTAEQRLLPVGGPPTCISKTAGQSFSSHDSHGNTILLSILENKNWIKDFSEKISSYKKL